MVPSFPNFPQNKMVECISNYIKFVIDAIFLKQMSVFRDDGMMIPFLCIK